MNKRTFTCIMFHANIGYWRHCLYIVWKQTWQHLYLTACINTTRRELVHNRYPKRYTPNCTELCNYAFTNDCVEM